MGRAINIMPLPTNTKQAISNVTRKKGRLVLTWLTLAVAGFMGIFGVFASIDKMIGDVRPAAGSRLPTGTGRPFTIAIHGGSSAGGSISGVLAGSAVS